MSTTRKIRCTDCGEPVPYGRLSCPSCGTLLASVAGGVRHGTAASPPTDGSAGTSGDAEEAMTDEAAAATAAMAARVTDPAPAAASTTTDSTAATSTVASASASTSPKDAGPAPTLQPREPKKAAPRTPAQRTASSRTLVPTTVVRTVTAAFAPAAAPVTATATAGAASPGAASLAGWSVPSPSMASGVASADTSGVAEAPEHERGPGFFDLDHLDLARVRAGLEWATALGSGLVAISLLLPWSRSVIGSAGVNSYFDSWGVAGPGHVLVLAWAIVLLGASILPNRAPTWVTRAVAPLTLGVFVLGLVWPYAVGPLGGQIGVVLAVIAAVVLIVSGLVGEWVTRHAADAPPV